MLSSLILAPAHGFVAPAQTSCGRAPEPRPLSPVPQTLLHPHPGGPGAGQSSLAVLPLLVLSSMYLIVSKKY